MSAVDAEYADRGLKTALKVVASTEDGRDVRRFMRSVYPATYVSEIRET